MDPIGKNIEIYLSTQLFPVASFSSSDLKKISGKLIEKSPNGFWIQVTKVGESRTAVKFPYAVLFIPTHKIDFMGIVS